MDMIHPEPATAWLAEVITEVLHTQGITHLCLDTIGGCWPQEVQNFTGAPNDVIRVMWFIHQDAVPVDAERIARWSRGEGKTVLALEHTRRANREGSKGIRELRECLLACGAPDVPTTEGTANRVGDKREDLRTKIHS
jgi:hypothetical protein